MSDSPETRPPLLDLSDLRLTPQWVSDFGKSSSSTKPDFDDATERPQRSFRDGGRDRDRRGPREQRGGGGGYNRDQRGPGPRGPREGGSGAGGGGGQFRGRGQGQGQGQGHGQGQGQGYRGNRDNRGPRGDRRDFNNRGGDRGDRRQFDAPVKLPEGLTAEIEPESKAVEAMSAMIRNAGKAYSVFDAARLVLSAGDRYHVKFSFPKEGEAKLYAIPADGSLWLSREEALEHFLNSEGIKEFYRMEQVELEVPKGNFTSIAICGLSGELLGPPSHHSYQTTLHRVHRERFGHMSFEDYKRRVRTENSPEIVEKWKESQSRGTVWIPITGADAVAPPPASPAAVEAKEQEEPAAAETEPSVIETEAGAEQTEGEAPAAEAEVEVEASPAADDAVSAESDSETSSDAEATAAEPAPAPAGLQLKSRAEMQAHFRKNFAPTLVHETSSRYVAGNIPRQNLHPALYQLLRRTVDETRKHLLALAQRLCNGFEHNGLKLFKRRGGKLWVSRTRPRLLDSTVVLSERISQMMEIIKTRPGISTKELVELVAPQAQDSTPAVVSTAAEGSSETAAPEATVADAPAAPTAAESAAQLQALKDLHWLNSEGYVIEYADGVVFPGVTEPPPPKPKAEKPKATPAADVAEGESIEPTATEAEDAAAATTAASSETKAAEVEEKSVELIGEIIETAKAETKAETESAPESESDAVVANEAPAQAASEPVSEEVETTEEVAAESAAETASAPVAPEDTEASSEKETPSAS